jgi:ATP-dependent helicase/nuclease subunit A
VAPGSTDHDDAFAEAYARFSVALDFASFEAMFATFETQRGRSAYLERCGGLRARSTTSGPVCGFYGASSVEPPSCGRGHGRAGPRPWRSAPTCC